jgi:phosphomannomutase
LEGFYDIDSNGLIETLKPQKIDHQDGLWLGFEEGFLHVRPSNTEPILRLIAESTSITRAQELTDIGKSFVSF